MSLKEIIVEDPILLTNTWNRTLYFMMYSLVVIAHYGRKYFVLLLLCNLLKLNYNLLSFTGVGVSIVVLNAVTAIYYNVIIAYSLFYLFASMQSTLPWSSCGSWADSNCSSTPIGAPSLHHLYFICTDTLVQAAHPLHVLF